MYLAKNVCDLNRSLSYLVGTSMVIESIDSFLSLLNMGRIDVTARGHAYLHSIGRVTPRMGTNVVQTRQPTYTDAMSGLQ